MKIHISDIVSSIFGKSSKEDMCAHPLENIADSTMATPLIDVQIIDDALLVDTPSNVNDQEESNNSELSPENPTQNIIDVNISDSLKKGIEDDEVENFDDLEEENRVESNLHVGVPEIIEKTPKHTSILDDFNSMTLINCCKQILTICEDSEFINTNIEYLPKIIKDKIFEYFIIIGARPIHDEDIFNPVRHLAPKGVFISPGSNISIEEPGIEIDGRVIIKAVVKVKNK